MNNEQAIAAPTKRTIAIPLIVLLLIVLIGAFVINAYITQERERDLQQWEARIGLVADAKVGAVQGFLGKSFDDLEELAANASLQLYLGQVLESRAENSSEGPQASFAYLRNLILASADRYGYWSQDAPRIQANIESSSISGLALLDTSFNPVVMTPGMPSMEAGFKAALQRVLEGIERQASGLVPEGQEQSVIVFVVPVHAVMGADASSKAVPIGLLVGVRSAERELFPLISSGAGFAEDSEALLLEMRDDRVVYLSSTRDGARPMQRSMPVSRARLAAAQAVTTLDGFGILDNYVGKSVLQVSRRIDRQTWVLAQQVDAIQALSESQQRRQFLLISLSLALLSIAAFAIAAWRHGSSVRARYQAAEFQQQATKLQRQTELLHAITDNIDVLTMLVSDTQNILFTNQALADVVGTGIGELIDSSLASAVGRTAAEELQPGMAQAREHAQNAHRVMSLRLGRAERIYQVGFIPVDSIGDRRDLMLLVFSDITRLQHTQRKHEKLLRNLVATLVHVVDLHDPYSAHHSSRIAEVSRSIGRELGLNRRELETLDLAASLSNVGKITIARELLVKTEELTAQEHTLLNGHVQTGLRLLKGLQFEGPVLETIAQKQELLDGSGYPGQLTGDQMSLPGKILSVANAFVALASPRAFRQAVPVREAVDILMRDADKRYDRQVLAALFHVSENLQASWSHWEDVPFDLNDE